MATVAQNPSVSARPTLKSRKGLTRTNGTRLINTSCSSGASRTLITSHHKSLARLAGESMRQISLQRGVSSGEVPLKKVEDWRRQRSKDIMEFRLSGNTENPSTDMLQSPPPLQRGDTLGVDELSLDVLCMHVSELLGGAPIPSASVKAQPIVASGGQMNSILDPSQAMIANGGAMATILDDSHENLDLEATEAETEPPVTKRETSDFRLSEVDMTAQIEAMQHYSNERLPSFSAEELGERASVGSAYGQVSERSLLEEEEEVDQKPAAATAPETHEERTYTDQIEVGPGEFLPLMASEETFHAIVCGKFAVTKCFGCMEELTVSNGADLVICSDCWLFSPVRTRAEGDDAAAADSALQVVGMGIKRDEVKQWLGVD